MVNIKHVDSSMRKLRLRLRLNQLEFARLLGVSQSSVSNWEIRGIRPRDSVIIKIMDICKDSGLRFPKDICNVYSLHG